MSKKRRWGSLSTMAPWERQRESRRTPGHRIGWSCPMRRVLLVAESLEDSLQYLVELRSRGLAAVGTRPSHAPLLVRQWMPQAVVLVRCGTCLPSLQQGLQRNRAPVVVVGPVDDFAAMDQARSVLVVTVPDSSGHGEAATAVEAVLGEPLPLKERPDKVEIGPLRIDFDGARVTLCGESLALPPKEFAILEELAFRVGEPVPSAELVRRVWPAQASATIEDVHRHVYRLRKRLQGDGENGCAAVRVANRRGFGYELILSD